MGCCFSFKRQTKHGCRWVYKIKRIHMALWIDIKARLGAKGYT